MLSLSTPTGERPRFGDGGLTEASRSTELPAKREFSVRYCITPFSCMTLLPVAPGAASFLRLAACTHACIEICF